MKQHIDASGRLQKPVKAALGPTKSRRRTEEFTEAESHQPSTCLTASFRQHPDGSEWAEGGPRGVNKRSLHDFLPCDRALRMELIGKSQPSRRTAVMARTMSASCDAWRVGKPIVSTAVRAEQHVALYLCSPTHTLTGSARQVGQ
jgi:hypothetical protein